MHRGTVLFKAPHKLDYMRLVPAIEEKTQRLSRIQRPTSAHTVRREGFELTDRGTDLVGALDEAQLLHLVPRAGQGLVLERTEGEGRERSRRCPFKKSPFGVPLAGCPLEEKISEFHKVKTRGYRNRRARRSSSSTIRWSRQPATASATTA